MFSQRKYCLIVRKETEEAFDPIRPGGMGERVVKVNQRNSSLLRLENAIEQLTTPVEALVRSQSYRLRSSNGRKHRS